MGVRDVKFCSTKLGGILMHLLNLRDSTFCKAYKSESHVKLKMRDAAMLIACYCGLCLCFRTKDLLAGYLHIYYKL